MLNYKEMLQAGIHFGHKTSLWCPKMRPYLWGAKNKIHLIDVSKTALLLERAGKFAKEVASKNGTFLFVGTKKPAQKLIEKYASQMKMPFVINRWVGGTLSNYDQVKKGISRLLHLRDVTKKSTTLYKKKEIVMINKEIDRLEKNIGGIIGFDYPPAAVIIVDPKKEQSATKEALKLGIPIIAMVDTNTNPAGISYMVPANDDSPKSIEFVLNYLVKNIEEGVEIAKTAKAEEQSAAAKEREAKRAAKKAEAPAKAESTEKEALAKAEKKAAPVKKVAPKAAPAKKAEENTEKKEAK
ncbi:MAG: 30S ribosomal protein S2 [Epsilonproteobacteria bacterium]|nr:30S ribosomal protein S2 [Campylobacterota bacterium]